MAWYSLYKWFIQFRKSPYINYIQWYKKHLYEEWFNSLSEKEQQDELERVRRLREKRKRAGEEALIRLGMIFSHLEYFNRGDLTRYSDVFRDIM